MSNLMSIAIESILNGQSSYCKFLSANDSGETGGHQSGILISLTAGNMFFETEDMQDNHILKKDISILWQDDISTNSSVTWYESKHELRITRFGRGFELLQPKYTGALFILVKENEEQYLGFILNSDDDIQNILDSFGLTPAETNRLIELDRYKPEHKKDLAIAEFIENYGSDFPSTSEMSAEARFLYSRFNENPYSVLIDPDNILLKWTDEEYQLFRAIEHIRYGNIVSSGFKNVDDFVNLANKVLNRRKSRAGKSLENHLSAIFNENSIKYTAQAITEGNKRPDFLFPSQEAYHDTSFSIDKLCTLAAKTTCKDRWRQILNEADRLKDKNKYLCTMQQGISVAQMDEMYAEKVILVVPKSYITSYPRERRERIWTIKQFVHYVKEMESI